jgi:hypothetical protein
MKYKSEENVLRYATYVFSPAQPLDTVGQRLLIGKIYTALQNTFISVPSEFLFHQYCLSLVSPFPIL